MTDIHDHAILIDVKIVQAKLGDVRIATGGGGRCAGFGTRTFRAAQMNHERHAIVAAGCAETIDPDELAPAPPVPQHPGGIQRRGRGGVIEMVQFVGNADLEAQAGIIVVKHRAFDDRVGRQGSAAAILTQIEQSHTLILPGSVLVEIERLATTIGLHQRHIVDIKTPVIDLIGTRLAHAHIVISFATDKILAIDLRCERHRSLPFARSRVIIAAATGQQSRQDARKQQAGEEKREGPGGGVSHVR